MTSSPTPPSGRTRRRQRPRARHRAVEHTESFARSLKALDFLARNGVQVSARICDLTTGEELLSVDDYVIMPTAGIGTTLLLIDVAARLHDTEFAALTILDRETADFASQGGIWQHLQAPSLPVTDVAALIGATGDNLATNVLLRKIGLDAVRHRTEDLGLRRMALLDLARDKRGPDDAPHLSVGSMKEVNWLFASLARGTVVDQATSQRVVGWLSLGHDLSLVASAFGLDPGAHRTSDHGLRLFNRTGVAAGLRAEAGVLTGTRAGVSYAVGVTFTDDSLQARLAVIDALRTIGYDLVEYVQD